MAEREIPGPGDRSQKAFKLKRAGGTSTTPPELQVIYCCLIVYVTFAANGWLGYKRMLMLTTPTISRAGANVILCGGSNSFGSKLAGTFADCSSRGGLQRCSPVLEWEGLKDVSCASESVCAACVVEAEAETRAETETERERARKRAVWTLSCCTNRMGAGCNFTRLLFESHYRKTLDFYGFPSP